MPLQWPSMYLTLKYPKSTPAAKSNLISKASRSFWYPRQTMLGRWALIWHILGYFPVIPYLACSLRSKCQGWRNTLDRFDTGTVFNTGPRLSGTWCATFSKEKMSAIASEVRMGKSRRCKWESSFTSQGTLANCNFFPWSPPWRSYKKWPIFLSAVTCTRWKIYRVRPDKISDFLPTVFTGWLASSNVANSFCLRESCFGVGEPSSLGASSYANGQWQTLMRECEYYI